MGLYRGYIGIIWERLYRDDMGLHRGCIGMIWGYIGVT